MKNKFNISTMTYMNWWSCIFTVRPVILYLISGHSSKAEVRVNNSIGFGCLFSSLDQQQYPHLPFCLVKSTEYEHVCMISEVILLPGELARACLLNRTGTSDKV